MSTVYTRDGLDTLAYVDTPFKSQLSEFNINGVDILAYVDERGGFLSFLAGSVHILYHAICFPCDSTVHIL